MLFAVVGEAMLWSVYMVSVAPYKAMCFEDAAATVQRSPEGTNYNTMLLNMQTPIVVAGWASKQSTLDQRRWKCGVEPL